MKNLVTLNSYKSFFVRIIVLFFIVFSSGFASETSTENSVKDRQELSLEQEDNIQPANDEEIFSLLDSLKISENLSQENSEYDSDSEDEEDYKYSPISLQDRSDLFKDKHFLPFFRGLHTTKSSFSDKSARRKFKRTVQSGKDIYSSAVYESYPEKDNDSEINEVRLALAKKVQTLVKEMEHLSSITIDKRYYTNFREYVQQLYTNNYDKFHDFLRDGKSTPFHEGQKKLGINITKNPFVSTSDRTDHAYKYAYGLKYLGKDVVKLMPEYDSTGRPKHPYLGKIISILIPFDALRELNPAFLLNLYAEGSIWVSTHFSNNILSEREITFPGYIPGQYVLLDLPVRVPSFHKEWRGWHSDKYGLTQKKFKDFKDKILATKGQISQQEEIVKKLREFIYPRLAQKLQNKISTFLESSHAHLSWKGLCGLSKTPLSLEDVKEEREARISEYTEPYELDETVRIEYLDFQAIKILTENLQNNKPFKVSIDEWSDDKSLSAFLKHPVTNHIRELTLYNFNVMSEIYQNLDVLREFIKRNKTLRLLSLIGTEEEYEEDVDHDLNNKYGLSTGHPLYDEDPAIGQFGEFIKEIIHESHIDVLELSENDLPKSAIRELKSLTKTGRTVKIQYYDYNQDRDQEELETMMGNIGFSSLKIYQSRVNDDEED